VSFQQWCDWKEAPKYVRRLRRHRSMLSVVEAIDMFREQFDPPLAREAVVAYYPYRLSKKFLDHIATAPAARTERYRGATIAPTRGFRKRYCVVFRISDVIAGLTPATRYFVCRSYGRQEQWRSYDPETVDARS
jgi:hypothetical protein